MSSDSSQYAYYSFPPTPERISSSPSLKRSSRSVTPFSLDHPTGMAPSPAAGKPSGPPKTPTRPSRTPTSTPQRPGQGAPPSAAKTPKLASATKPTTDSPKPLARSGAAGAGSKEKEATDNAEDAAADAQEQAQDDHDDGDDKTKNDNSDKHPLKKIGKKGGSAKQALHEAAPEPVSEDENEDKDDNEDEDDEDDEDAVEGAKKQATDTAQDAGEEAEDVADDATEKAGQTLESADDTTTDDQEQSQQGKDVLGKAKGLAGKATDTAKDVTDKSKAAAEDAAEDPQATAEEGLDEAQKVPGEVTDEVGDATDGATSGQLPEMPEGLPIDLSILKGLEVAEDGTVTDRDGNAIGRLVEGDAEDLAGYPIGDDGEILDDDGDLVGRVELLPDEIKRQLRAVEEENGELPEDAQTYLGQLDELTEQAGDGVEGYSSNLPGLNILEGLTCQIDGLVYDADGNTVGQVVDGDPEQLQNATLNDQGEFVDEDGNVVGRAEIHEEAAELVEQGIYAPAETAAEGAEDEIDEAAEGAQEGVGEAGEIEDQLPGIEALQGKELNEAGEILDDEGNLLGDIEDDELKQKIADGEIDPNNLRIDEEGNVIDSEGNVLGKTQLAEGAAERLAGGPLLDFRILDGKKINKKGKILDEDGEEIGELTDGELQDCTGKKVNHQGEVLDKQGNVIGHVRVVPGEAAENATKELLEELGELPQDAEEKMQEVPLSVLEGLKVNKKGQVLNEDGEPIGELTEGELSDCAGKKINADGEVLDADGNVIGRVRTLPQPAEEEGEGEDSENNRPPLSTLEGLKVNKSGKLVDDSGAVVGELVEGDAKKLSKLGITSDAEGQFWDNKGHVIGRAITLPQEDAEDEAIFAGLEGLHVVDDGWVVDKNGNYVGQVNEGDAKALIGREVDEDGDILDKNGSVVGHAERVPDQPEQEPADLSFLQGKTVTKSGLVIGDEGVPVARLIEGNAKDLAGKELDEEGQIWNDKGKIIGRVELIPEEEREQKPEGPFAGLDDLRVIEGGKIADEDGNVVGQIVEGNPKRLVGLKVDEDGDIVDKYGNVKGHAEPLPDEPDVDFSILDGLTLNKTGYVVDSEGVPFGKLIEGEAAELAGRKCDENGYIYNDTGKVVGRCEPIPEDERVAKPEGPFAGLQGLRVVKDGKVEDGDGNIVGEITEGDSKRLVGLAVDEDGDIIDKFGNTKGHAEPFAEEEPEEVDNSPLNNKTLNKQGYVVDENGIPFGRLIEGNASELAGRKCDEKGYIYGDTGKVVGRCQILPEDERVARPEGPFAGLEGLRVVKGGKVEDADGNAVGEIVEGDAKRLVGLHVDEDGDIIDKYGNVKGHAAPLEDEEEVDLSRLNGTTINKAGYAVDGSGQVVGRVVDGDTKAMVGSKVDGKGQIWDNAGNVVGRAELVSGVSGEEGPFAGFEGLQINKDGTITTPAGDIIGRVVEGDIKKLLGHTVDEDGDINDKNGNTIGKAERWEPEEKERRANRMSGMRVNKEGEVRDENGDLIGRLTEGDLGHCVGQEIDDAGNVVDVDGNKIGEVTLIENIAEDYEGPTDEELEEARKREEERQIAEKMSGICTQTLERMQPICKQITEHMEKADRTPKEELDEDELVNKVQPLIEEGGRILQECNGSLRGLDPDGRIAAQAKGRAGTGEATPEEYRLAETLKELTTTVVTTIDNAKKKLNSMPHAKKKLNPLWALMTQPLFQILAAVGLLLAGVLGLVGQLLNGLGLGGLVNGLLGGLGINKLLASFGLIDEDKNKGKGKGKSALSSIPIVGGFLGGNK